VSGAVDDAVAKVLAVALQGQPYQDYPAPSPAIAGCLDQASCGATSPAITSR
jgi:hypothetical protein